MKTVCAIALVVGAAAAPASGEPLIDGKEPLVCANVEAVYCERGEACEKGLPEYVGAPSFMRVDFDRKEVVGPKRTSPILQSELGDTTLSLQGFELGMGWTLAIDRATGNMSMTLVGLNEVYVVFGACTEQAWLK